MIHDMGHIWDDMGGFPSHGGTPSYHPFLGGIFHEINHPAIGVPSFVETPYKQRIVAGRNHGTLVPVVRFAEHGFMVRGENLWSPHDFVADFLAPSPRSVPSHSYRELCLHA